MLLSKRSEYEALKTYVDDLKSIHEVNKYFDTMDSTNQTQRIKAVDMYSKALIPFTSLVAIGTSTITKLAKGDDYYTATQNNHEQYSTTKAKLSKPRDWLAQTVKLVGDKDFRDRLISDMEYLVDHGFEASLSDLSDRLQQFDAKAYFGEFRTLSTQEDVESRGRRREDISLKKGLYAFSNKGLKLSETNEKIVKRQLVENMMNKGFVKREGYFNPETLDTGLYDAKHMNVVSPKQMQKQALFELSEGYRYSFVGAEDSLVSKIPINKDLKKALSFGRNFQLYADNNDVNMRKKAVDSVTDTMGVLTTLGVAGGVALAVSSAPTTTAVGVTYGAYKGTQTIVKPVTRGISNFAKLMSDEDGRKRFKSNFKHFVNYELEDVLQNAKEKISTFKLRYSDEESTLRTQEKNNKHLKRAVYAKYNDDISFNNRDKKLYLSKLDEQMDSYVRTEVFFNPTTNEMRYYDKDTYQLYSAEDYKAILDRQSGISESNTIQTNKQMCDALNDGLDDLSETQSMTQ